jgi:hypothetical protein
MNSFIKLSPQDRNLLLKKISHESGINLAILEKDFWVCWALEQLSKIPELKDKLVFKGGTSLSKVYNLINRFSEDIDLILKQDYLNNGKEILTSSQQNRFLKKSRKQIREELLPLIKKKFAESCNEIKEGDIVLDNTMGRNKTILFYFPSVFKKPTSSFPYTFPINFEEPKIIKTINPYLKQYAPILFEKEENILFYTIDVNRTFWEKLTILHRIATMPKEMETPSRYSRHYYDVYMFISKEKHIDALNFKHFLSEIVENDIKFFRRSYCNYDSMKIGSLKLVPENKEKIKELHHDYISMKQMFFKDIPAFEDIINKLLELENIINS